MNSYQKAKTHLDRARHLQGSAIYLWFEAFMAELRGDIEAACELIDIAEQEAANVIDALSDTETEVQNGVNNGEIGARTAAAFTDITARITADIRDLESKLIRLRGELDCNKKKGK